MSDQPSEKRPDLQLHTGVSTAGKGADIHEDIQSTDAQIAHNESAWSSLNSDRILIKEGDALNIFDERSQRIIRKISDKGYVLSEECVLQLAMNLHKTHQLTKSEYTMIVLYNHHQSTLSEDLKKQIDVIWRESATVLDDMALLKSYSDDTLSVYDYMDGFFDDEVEARNRQQMIRLRKEYLRLQEQVDNYVRAIGQCNLRITSILQECEALGHLPSFTDSSVCRACGEKIGLTKSVTEKTQNVEKI